MTDTYCMVPVHTQVEGKEQNIATYPFYCVSSRADLGNPGGKLKYVQKMSINKLAMFSYQVQIYHSCNNDKF
jgi:hypothetical protein